MDTATLIRGARYEAALSQHELARRAGISASTLSRLEAGKQQPAIGTLTTVLAVVGKQIHAELEPLDEDIRRAIVELERQPLHDRPAVLDWSTLTNPENLPHRVEGLAAAAILAAPIPVDRFDLALADEDATYEWLSHEAQSWVVRIKVPSWSSSEVVQQPADQIRQLIARECPDGVFEIECLGFVGHVTLRPADIVANHTRVEVPRASFPSNPSTRSKAPTRAPSESSRYCATRRPPRTLLRRGQPSPLHAQPARSIPSTPGSTTGDACKTSLEPAL